MLPSWYLYEKFLACGGREASRVEGVRNSPSTCPKRRGRPAFLRMAAVSLSPAPFRLGNMTSRRVPLSNVPNAANSPFRAVAAVASKRSRDQLEAQEDLSYDYHPHPKRQALEEARTNLRVSPRKQALQSAEGRLFNRRTANAPPTAFERKLLAARGERSQQRVERQEKASNEAMDTVRQWQKHYKKSFPGFVFYFESVPEDVRLRCSRWVRSLGAVSSLPMLLL